MARFDPNSLIGMTIRKAGKLASSHGYYPIFLRKGEETDKDIREIKLRYECIVFRYNDKNKVTKIDDL